MARLRPNFQYGVITDNPLLVGATSANSVGFANLPVVSSPDYLEITLDPKAVVGAQEIAWVTAHALNSTTVTIARAQENTLARQHAQNEVWICGPTSQDFATAGPSVSNVGDTAFIGTEDPYAKADHLHGREGWYSSLPAALLISAGATGSANNPARGDHLHPVTGVTPHASAVGDTAAIGSNSLAAGDHKHAREGFGTPLSSAPTDSPIQGTGPQVSAYNHVHGREGVGTPFSTSNPGDGGLKGSGPQITYFDHKHPREAWYSSTPHALNYGDPGSPGTSGAVSRGDHSHPHSAPTAVFGYMDNSGPTLTLSNVLTTISGFGPPFAGPITVPPSGIMVVNWQLVAYSLNNFPNDIYIGVGWSSAANQGGQFNLGTSSSLGSPGHGAFTNAQWSVISTSIIDNYVNSLSSGFLQQVYTYSGTWYLNHNIWPNLVPNSTYYFYLLWGYPSSNAGGQVCPSNNRGGAQFGTWIEAIQVP